MIDDQVEQVRAAQTLRIVDVLQAEATEVYVFGPDPLASELETAPWLVAVTALDGESAEFGGVDAIDALAQATTWLQLRERPIPYALTPLGIAQTTLCFKGWEEK